jgi:hypothetical protein
LAQATHATGTTLCTTFRERAAWTWTLAGEGIQHNARLSEETITDINLLEIKRAHPLRVRLRKYSKREESGQTGADWEWWLVGRSRSLKLRIQAKVVTDPCITA